jgi:hypothetical protein
VTAIASFREWRQFTTKEPAEGIFPDYLRGFCNPLEFKELRDQNKNTYKPYTRHCGSSHFARVWAGASPRAN